MAVFTKLLETASPSNCHDPKDSSAASRIRLTSKYTRLHWQLSTILCTTIQFTALANNTFLSTFAVASTLCLQRRLRQITSPRLESSSRINLTSKYMRLHWHLSTILCTTILCTALANDTFPSTFAATSTQCIQRQLRKNVCIVHERFPLITFTTRSLRLAGWFIL